METGAAGDEMRMSAPSGERFERTAVIGKRAVELVQRRQLAIFNAEIGCHTKRKWPVNSNAVPGNSAVVLWRIGVRAFVDHLTIGLQRQKSVREADGHKQLVAVLGGSSAATHSPYVGEPARTSTATS